MTLSLNVPSRRDLADGPTIRGHRATRCVGTYLRVALGWERLPATTLEEQAEFDAELAWRDEEIRRYYGKPAA